MDTFRDLFETNVCEFRDKTAVQDPATGSSLTYGELDVLAGKLAAKLKEGGVVKGDVIAIVLPHSIDFIAAILASMKLGAAFAPLNVSYPQARLEYIYQDCKAKAVITPDYMEDVADYSPVGEITQVTPEDVAFLIYTSGSTGNPKGVLIDHRTLLDSANRTIQFAGFNASDVIGLGAPFFFIAGELFLFCGLTLGAVNVLTPISAMRNPAELSKVLASHQVTAIFISPKMLRFFKTSPGSRLRLVMTAGERLTGIYAEDFQIINAYGLSESCATALGFHLDRAYDNTPIGKPIGDIRAYLLDEEGNEAEEGELCLTGLFARCYLNHPEESARTFIPNPFREKDGNQVMLKTGDLARILPDGNFLFLNRKDWMVKINGQRVEPGEIEAALRKVSGINDVAVKDFTDDLNTYLVAYYVSENEFTDEKLRQLLAEKLPEYMIPAFFIRLESLPVNDNGKVDRGALPKPEQDVAKETGDTTRELTALEQELQDICAEVLGGRRPDVNISLTDAGLTSVSTVQLMTLLEKKYGYSPDVSDMQRDMRLIDIENILTAHWRESSQMKTADDKSCEDVLRAPVTQTQLGIYLECRMDETSDKYNLPMLLKVGADTDEARLAAAIRSAVEAHPAMKSSFEPDKDFGAVMIAHPDLEWEIPIEKSELDDAQLEKELSGERTVFNLRRAPLFMFRIIRSNKSVYLSIVFHHILMDGTSVAVLMEDIEKAYQGEKLEKEHYSSLQLCLDEKKRRSSDELPAAKAVYEGIFSGVSLDSLPDPEKSSGKEETGKAAIVRHELSGLTAEEVSAFCKANNVTENALFTAAFAVLLARMGGCDEALFTSIYNGRTRMETMRIMGMLVKTYPIYVNCAKESKSTDFILSVQKLIRELTANDLYSFAEAVRDFGVNANIMFAYQGDFLSEFTLAGQKAGQIERPLEDAMEPLSVDVWKKDGTYTVSFEYREDMYTDKQIQWMANIYGMLVRGLMSRETLGQIQALSAEAEAFLNDINDTTVNVPFRPVYSLMEEAAAENPERIAVITPSTKVTYRTLNENANRIAHTLIDLGALGHIVALILPRSEQVYMVRQGILKAGAAFLSITPDYPDERIRAMIEDSKAAVLIATEDILKERGDFLNSLGCQVVAVEKLLQDERTDNPDQPVKKDDLAYCIFTSGSTGRPKGVMLTQGNLQNFLDANKKNPEILGYTERGHVSLAIAAITFDVSIMEEFIPLSHGMTICMATEEEIHNPVALAKLMTNSGVDVMTCTPSFLSNCVGLSVMKEAFANIVSYDLGAEAFPASLFDKIRAVSPNALIMNGYGPTEATISCTMDPVTDSKLITIGRPASNVRAYILDEQGSVLPPLLPGELVIAGEGVGRGYVGMSELTAEKFIILDGYRAYRTGDLAAWTSDGRLKFHGRADNQVKLRGLRIELGEIENAINAVPGVLTSIVIMTGKETNQFLAGYYTASRDISPQEVRDEIKKTLASYMVPGVLTLLEEMPLTANGKVDKKKLPKVEAAPENKDYEAPANETEEFFCKLFREVLDVDGIGATDDFFACGGTSLSATSIMVRASEENYPLSYGDVFKYKTPRALAALFTKTQENAKPSSASIFDDYDYTDINELLSKNTIESFAGSESRPIGNILITGATGYMGIHVLEDFLKNESGKAWCLVRKGKYKSAFERLRYSMFYYFQDPLMDVEDRIEVIDGDVTDYETLKSLENMNINTVFNCAANVKHFSSGTDIEDINVGGAENTLRFCLETGARLIHFSTTSVGGYLKCADPAEVKQLDEQSLYFGQIVDNQYLSSKLLAERIILEAVARKGADAKVIRVGALSARESDGEFQINFLTNSAMGQLRSYAILKSFPYSDMSQDMHFGPIDTSVRSFMYLARTPKANCLFHAVNNHSTPTIDVIRVMQESGIEIELVEDDVFLQRLQEADQDPAKAAILSSILAYKDFADGAVPVVEKYEYTNQVLARSGFFWNTPDETYIRKFIEDLAGMAFFDVENLYR